MIAWFARHPTAANLLMLGLMTAGLIALPQLRRETFPEFAAGEVQVTAVWPGASAEDVEEGVCRRLEDALEAVSNLAELSCEAREGQARAVAEMLEDGDMSRFLDDVKSEVDAIDDLPEEVELPTVSELNRTDQVVSVAITGPMSDRDLKAYAEQVKDRMKALPDVSLVEVQGFSDHQLRIEVSQNALRRHGLSLAALGDVLEKQGIDLPAGNLEGGPREWLVRFTDQRRSARELADLVVLSGSGGGELRLGDIARVTDRFEQDDQKVLFDGRRAALLSVTKNRSEDTLVVVDGVRSFLERERQLAPSGVNFTLTQDLSSIVRDRLQMLLRNGSQGLLLVFGVMWLFFRLRFAFWVAMGLPVSFLAGLVGMVLLGHSINMITMVALLVALGLLMDDAIVISENVAARLARGLRPVEAAIEGAREVAPGVLASFFTTVLVFGPLAFLSGNIGRVLQVLPVVLIIVIAVSLLEAFLILPNHLGHALGSADTKEPSRFRRRFGTFVEHARENWVGRAVDAAMRQRYLFLGCVVALVIATVGMLAGGLVKFRAFPDVEGDVMQARVLMPQGTPLWRTELVVDRLSAALERVDEAFSEQQPDGERLVQSVSVQYGVNADSGESGPHLVTISADLLTAERRVGEMEAYLERWRTETGSVPDVLTLTFKEPTLGPAGKSIEVRLVGSDLTQLKSAALELQNWLGRFAGVRDLADDLRPGKPEVRLRLKTGALQLGVDASTVARQLRTALAGRVIREIQVGPESYEIDLRLQGQDRDALSDLEDFRVGTADGALVPLTEVVELEPGRGWARIARVNGRRTVTVEGDVDSRLANAGEIVSAMRQEFLPGLFERYPDVSVDQQGQARESAETGQSLLRAMLIGLFGVFFLLSFQFRSYVQPLVVMSVIPLGLIGVVFGHRLMGLELSMPSIIGFVSLAGVAVNDSILLVEFLKRGLREGLSVPVAAARASRERFRAVLLTSLTTVAGLTPLLLERSLQAQVLIPLAASLVFGLIATTLLVLFVVPTLFSVLDDFGLVREGQAGADKESPSSALTGPA